MSAKQTKREYSETLELIAAGKATEPVQYRETLGTQAVVGEWLYWLVAATTNAFCPVPHPTDNNLWLIAE